MEFKPVQRDYMEHWDV